MSPLIGIAAGKVPIGRVSKKIKRRPSKEGANINCQFGELDGVTSYGEVGVTLYCVRRVP